MAYGKRSGATQTKLSCTSTFNEEPVGCGVGGGGGGGGGGRSRRSASGVWTAAPRWGWERRVRARGRRVTGAPTWPRGRAPYWAAAGRMPRSSPTAFVGALQCSGRRAAGSGRPLLRCACSVSFVIVTRISDCRRRRRWLLRLRLKLLLLLLLLERRRRQAASPRRRRGRGVRARRRGWWSRLPLERHVARRVPACARRRARRGARVRVGLDACGHLCRRRLALVLRRGVQRRRWRIRCRRCRRIVGAAAARRHHWRMCTRAVELLRRDHCAQRVSQIRSQQSEHSDTRAQSIWNWRGSRGAAKHHTGMRFETKGSPTGKEVCDDKELRIQEACWSAANWWQRRSSSSSSSSTEDVLKTFYSYEYAEVRHADLVMHYIYR